jgi:uncharacterized protein YqhQ
MPAHDEMALSARLDGQTSAQYRQAAQKHANATWIYLLIAGAVLIFTSWVFALIPVALAVFVMCQSFSATKIAKKLEEFEKQSGVEKFEPN